MVSVPFPGFLYINLLANISLNTLLPGFRPLSGVSIYQSCPLYPLYSLGFKARLRRKTISGL